ncbi:MAG: hypothetical protein IT261_03630 [Saprospiraceae bacterium]|nr:hypothetical protein [Saprospiraceae bacterium]
MKNNTELFIEQITQNLEKLSTFSVDSLQRKEELGRELNFSEGADLFEKVLNFLKLMEVEKLPLLPEKQLKALSEQINHLASLFDQIQKFSVTGLNNPKQQRDQLIISISKAFGDLFEAAQPVVSFFNIETKENKRKDSSNAVKKSLEELKKEKEEMVKSGTLMLNQINELLESSRKAAGTIGVSQYSKVFAEESDYFENSAGKWLWRVFGVLVLLMLAGGGFIRVGMNEMVQTNTLMLINVTVSKVLIITALFYSLNLCLKNYKAHKHNALLNRHRQNALNTFETFAKAAGDDSQTKNAVLLEATRTIFSNQPTGYMTNENESEFPTRIIEIIKSNKE